MTDLFNEKIEYYYYDNGQLKTTIIEPVKKYYYSTSYQFNVGIAQKYGVNEAIFLNNLIFWIKKNIANEKHCYDGYYWTYNSITSFEKLFPFWTKRQIRTVIEKLKEKNIIKTGNYNKSGYDRTKWYAIKDPSICQICQIENPIMTNQFDQNDKPIPDINTDNKTYINTDIDNSDKELKEQIDEIYKLYPARCIITNRSLYKSSKNKEKIKKLLKEKGFDFLKETILLYLKECKKSNTYMKNFNTFLNNFPDLKEEKESLSPASPVYNDGIDPSKY